MRIGLKDPEENEQVYVIPNIVYTGGQPDVSGEGPVTLSMPFQATLDPAIEGTNIVIQRIPNV